MTLQNRIENLSTENLKSCALGLFADHEDDSADVALNAVLQELEIRMGDEFVSWADENF